MLGPPRYAARDEDTLCVFVKGSRWRGIAGGSRFKSAVADGYCKFIQCRISSVKGNACDPLVDA